MGIIQARQATVFVYPIETRLPFRYGIAHMTWVHHLFLRLEVEIDGQLVTGWAADHLVPKWFTKNPNETYESELSAMREVVESAAKRVLDLGPLPDVFSVWHSLYQSQKEWAQPLAIPPLLWNFGVSLVERALIHAFSCFNGKSFAVLLRGNHFGIELGLIHPELAGFSPAEFLLENPQTSLYVRHTIGLADPIRKSEIPPEELKLDGLPQSLEDNIHRYQLQYFKIKLQGLPHEDLKRIEDIAELFQSNLPNYSFTLDGNEQFLTVESFRDFWDDLRSKVNLQPFLSHLLFVEQPFSRQTALGTETAQALLNWRDRPVMIIDESDAELGSLPAALNSGYSGTSHKNCKGVIKSVANACLLAYRQAQNPAARFVLSAEDLVNTGPIALQQDLAVVASLGLSHVERNGHHYFAGLSMFPDRVQSGVQESQPDLYALSDLGYPTLKIKEGQISVGSVVNSAFGIGIVGDNFEPVQNHPLTDVWFFENNSILK